MGSPPACERRAGAAVAEAEPEPETETEANLRFYVAYALRTLSGSGRA